MVADLKNKSLHDNNRSMFGFYRRWKSKKLAVMMLKDFLMGKKEELPESLNEGEIDKLCSMLVDIEDFLLDVEERNETASMTYRSSAISNLILMVNSKKLRKALLKISLEGMPIRISFDEDRPRYVG